MVLFPGSSTVAYWTLAVSCVPFNLSTPTVTPPDSVTTFLLQANNTCVYKQIFLTQPIIPVLTVKIYTYVQLAMPTPEHSKKARGKANNSFLMAHNYDILHVWSSDLEERRLLGLHCDCGLRVLTKFNAGVV